MRNGLVSALCLWVAALVSFPANADIAAFNKAVEAKDYKTATVEAASTWPGLDKSREDIGVIANEFAYAAFRSGDFNAAKTYAEFTVARPSTANDQDLTLAATLLRDLSQHRLAPNAQTRAALAAGVKQRAARPGFDNVSFIAADGLTAQDIADKAWKSLADDAAMSAQMSAAGGSYYAATKRHFEHLATLGRYMDGRPPAVLADSKALLETIVADIDAAPNDDTAKEFVPVYWEVSSFKFSLERDVASRTNQSLESLVSMPPKRSERFKRLVTKYDGCARTPADFDLPPIPNKLSRLETSVTIEMDIDEKGRVPNAQVVGSLLDPLMASKVEKWAKSLKFKPGAPWDDSRCKLEKTGYVMQLEIQKARVGR